MWQLFDLTTNKMTSWLIHLPCFPSAHSVHFVKSCDKILLVWRADFSATYCPSNVKLRKNVMESLPTGTEVQIRRQLQPQKSIGVATLPLKMWKQTASWSVLKYKSAPIPQQAVWVWAKLATPKRKLQNLVARGDVKRGNTFFIFWSNEKHLLRTLKSTMH